MNDALRKAQEAMKKKREAGEEIERVEPHVKALKAKPNELRARINGFCYECVGHSRSEVKKCTAVKCPLHACRPWQDKKDNE